MVLTSRYDERIEPSPAPKQMCYQLLSILECHRGLLKLLAVGLMDGTNFWTILTALKDEGLLSEAAHVEEMMRNRTSVGVTNKCRFGSPLCLHPEESLLYVIHASHLNIYLPTCLPAYLPIFQFMSACTCLFHIP